MSYPYNGRGIGPSGEPHLHFILKNSRSEAEEAAKQAGLGQPIHHTAHEKGQYPHFHPADRSGEIIKNGQHFCYPNNSKFFP